MLLIAIAALADILLLGFLISKFRFLRNDNYFKVLTAALLTGFVAFVLSPIFHQRFNIYASFVFGFSLGFLSGAVWSGVLQVIVTTVPLKNYKWFPDKSEIWWTGVLPSCVFQGYLIARLEIDLLWIKSLLVFLLAVSIVKIAKSFTFKSLVSQNKPLPPIRIGSSPILWIPIIIFIVISGFNVWIK